MNPETISAIQSALAPIAEKIGQGAQYGWEIVVRQQYIIGITDFVIAGVMALGVIGLVCWAFALNAGAKKASPRDQEGYFIGIMLAVFSSMFLCVFLTGFLVDGVKHTLSPEYYALDFFIHLVK